MTYRVCKIQYFLNQIYDNRHSNIQLGLTVFIFMI